MSSSGQIRRNLVVLIALSKPSGPRFSPGQRRLARLLALGCDDREIALLLGQSLAAVRRDTIRLTRRLRAADLAALRVAARRLRLITPNDRLSVVERRRLGRA